MVQYNSKFRINRENRRRRKKIQPFPPKPHLEFYLLLMSSSDLMKPKVNSVDEAEGIVFPVHNINFVYRIYLAR